MRSHRSIALLVGLIVALLPSAPNAAHVTPRVEPGLLAGDGPVDVLARFEGRIPREIEHVDGLSITYRFASVPAIAATASASALRRLGARADLVWLERDHTIEPDLDSATVASRAREVWDPPSGEPVRDDDGNVVDGRGVGIAIVDTGLDEFHPDFQAPGKVGGNFLVVPGAVVPAPYTAVTSGHGTHVAGIAAGNGSFSGGRYRGVAPGATVYAFAAVTRVSFAATAFDWILQNGHRQDPPIRIVNNSWHCATPACAHPENGNGLHMVLASRMAESGITVTWAAGNEIGDGDVATINPEATNPTPGIIGVANYKDTDWPGLPNGTRDGCLSTSSAWGTSGDPSTWPDLAAPGRSITSTWSMGVYPGNESRNPVNGSVSYRQVSGTSMAAPHVAGAAALLLQVNPSLTPVEIEYILKRTATPLTGPAGEPGCGIGFVKADPAHPWTGSNYAAGHGLIDAVAGVALADGFDGIPAAPPVEPLPPGFVVVRTGYRADKTLYLSGDSGMTASYPDAPAPRVRALAPGSPAVVHTSEPLGTTITADALKVDLFVGISSEARDALSVIGTATLFAIVERVLPDGTRITLAELARVREAARGMWPIHRDFVHALDPPATFDPEDRIRVSIRVVAAPYQGVEPAVNGWWSVYTESWTPSRISFSTRIRPSPGSREYCERVRWCAQVDELHPYEGLQCSGVPMRMRWTGPPGSMLLLACNGVITPCPVVAAPGEKEGTCELEVTVPVPFTPDPGAWCFGMLPGGARGGRGECSAAVPILD